MSSTTTTSARAGASTRSAAVVVALVTALALLVAPGTAAAQGGGFTNVEQLDVSAFAAAGVAVSQRTFTPESATSAVLATDANFPDGLTASAVASSVGGPVLFTGPDGLDEGTAAELERLLVDGDTVHLMGGEQAIGAAVEQRLAERYTVVRIAGPSRLETAVEAARLVGVPASGRVLIARAFGPDGAGTPSDRTTGWVDAISCGAYAAAEGIPILLTQTDVLSGATRDALTGLGATSATICGGVAAVGDGVAQELAALNLSVDRVEGPTRVETAVAVAEQLFGRTSATGAYSVVPGYGESFGYGLAAAPLGNPILLVGTSEPTACDDASQPSRATLCHLADRQGDAVADLLVVGGDAVIGDAVVDAAGEAAGGTDIAGVAELAAPTGVTAEDDVDDDGTALSVQWTAVADPDDILAGYNVFVDGRRFGMTDPTVGAATTQLDVTGLTEGRQVSITVTAVDVAGRESDPSQAVTATPEDEAPAAITGFTATPGDGKVSLAWQRGPADTASYSIRRATASGGSCQGVSYTQVTSISDPATTTFVDDEPVNGTAYCYRHVTVDRGGNEGAPNDRGPVTPAVPQLGIRIVNVDDRFTFHTGFPHVIKTTTTLDAQTSVGQLDLVVEFVPDGTALPSIVIYDGDHPATLEADTIFRLLETDVVGAAKVPATEYDDAQGTLRATVIAGNRLVEDVADDVFISRAPERVSGVKAQGGNGQVLVTWDQSPEPTTTEYRIERGIAPVTAQNDDPAACDNPAVQYTQVAQQPKTQAREYRDSDVSNGNQVSDNRYCYRVRAIRPPQQGLDEADQVGQASVVDSANPDIVAASLTIDDPEGDALVRERQERTVRWTIAVPQGGTASTDTTLEYCVDYRQALGQTQPACQDVGGFKEMELVGGAANPVASAVGAGQTRTFTARWAVPSLEQNGTTTGAVRMATQGGVDVNTGIQFR